MQDWKIEPAHDLGLAPLERTKSLSRESGLLATAGHVGYWSLIRTFLRLYHRLQIEGAHHIPTRPPFVMISNHASHLDAMVLASPLSWRIRDQVFPIAAGDVFFQTPVISFFAAGMLNALPMWRKKAGAHALHQLRERLIAEPCSYILFPEGTRSRDGTMASFRAGLGMLVAGTKVPVVPCHLEGTHAALRPGQRIPRPHRIIFRIGEPILFDSLFDDRTGWEEVARRSEEAVRALTQHPPAESKDSDS
jgi:1-acyl-sn-glycerol-3-phosphate acyltransferase